MTREGFEKRLAEGGFIESAVVHGNLYGSPKAPVVAALEDGCDVLMNMDVQGAAAVQPQSAETVLPRQAAQVEQGTTFRPSSAARHSSSVRAVVAAERPVVLVGHRESVVLAALTRTEHQQPRTRHRAAAVAERQATQPAMAAMAAPASSTSGGRSESWHISRKSPTASSSK